MNFMTSSFRFSSSSYRPWNDTTATEEENLRAKKAYEAVLTVTGSSSKTEDYEAFSKAVKQVAKSKFNYSYDEPVNNFVANFHDAVRAFPY